MALGTTVSAMIQRVKRDSLLVSRGQVYTLNGALDAVVTIVTFNETVTHIAQGSLLSIDDEIMFVQEMNASAKTASVLRGFMGTTAATHADNAFAEVDPRMPAASLLDFAQQEILSWGNELFQVEAVDIDVARGSSSSDLGIAAGADIFFLLSVRSMPTDGSGHSAWNFSWTGDSWPKVTAKLIRNMDVGEFASGYALQTLHPAPRAQTLRVVYATPFDLDPFTGATDLLADAGLQPEWLEIVEWGVRQRAYQALIMGRTDFRSGSMSQEYEAVSTFDIMRAADQAGAQRLLKFTKAATDLRGKYPYTEGR